MPKPNSAKAFSKQACAKGLASEKENVNDKKVKTELLSRTFK
jgi:hypothetical protein